MADFSSYLDVPVDNIPKTLPSLGMGHYFATVKGWKTAERFYDGKSNPGTPVVEVTFTITGPDDDVADWQDSFRNRPVTKDYTLNDPDRTGQVMLRRLGEETCGVDVKGLALTDLLEAMKGCEVKVYNEPRSGKEEGQFFPNIKKVLPL